MNCDSSFPMSSILIKLDKKKLDKDKKFSIKYFSLSFEIFRTFCLTVHISDNHDMLFSRIG